MSCQKRNRIQVKEALYPTFVSTLWAKVRLDIIYILTDRGKGLLVITRDDLLG